jgi:hypothetical protein
LDPRPRFEYQPLLRMAVEARSEDDVEVLYSRLLGLFWAPRMIATAPAGK